MKKTSLFLVGLFFIALLALAACGGGGDEEPPPTSLPVPTAAPAPISPTPTATPVPVTPRATPLPILPVIVDEVTEAGTLSILEGKAEFRPEGGAAWLTATDGMSVIVDSHVRTLNVSTAVIQFAEGSRVKLEPNTELVVEVFELLSRGPPTGQRVVKVRLVDGSISFDVTSAPTPPNVWEFLTADGIIAIHGTQGSLSSRESALELVLNILEGEATLAHVRINEDTGEPELDLFTVEDGSVVSLPSSAQGLTVEDIDTLLGIAEIIALGGKDAVEQVSASGDIDAGVAIGLSAFAGAEGAVEVVRILSEISEVLEAAGDRINLVSEADLYTIDFDLLAGTVDNGIVQVSLVEPGAENIGNFVSSSLDKIAAVSALGKLPDTVADLLEGFAEKFLPPEAEDLFDENGTLIGVKRPDIVVFDEVGNPVGKQLGDIFAVNLDGTIDEEGELPDIFYIVDPFDDESGTGLAVAGLIDLLPTAAKERGDIGLLETWVPNLVAFDENGDIVHTIFEFDEEGNLSGTKAFSGKFVDENGRPIDIPINEFLKTDEEGNIIGQKEIPFVALDENGDVHEFILPEPIVHDEDGNAIGIQLPSVFLVGEDGRLDGLEVGGVITKEFLLGLEALRPDHDIPEGAVFDSDRVLFDSEGVAHTADEFRPSMIIRGEDGEVVGHRIATEITCITSKCLEEISLDQKILALIEEAVHVLVEDAEGGFTIAELEGVALHDENGEFVGVVNPQTLLIDQESGRVKGFLESKTDLIEEFKEFFTGVKDFFDESGEHLGTFDAELEKSQFVFALERGDEFKPQEFAHVDEFGEKLDPGDLPDFRGFSVTNLEDFALGEAFGGDLGFSQEELKQLFSERSQDHVDEGPAPDDESSELREKIEQLKEAGDEEALKQLIEEFDLAPDGQDPSFDGQDPSLDGQGPPPDGQEPPPDEHREPPPDENQEPPPDEHQEPPPDGNQQPPPDEHQEPPPDDGGQQEPPPDGNQQP